MTTTFFLVRHASHDLLGRVLAGRMEGVGLSTAGHDEAGRVAGRLSSEPVRAVYSSPLQRARETADPIANAHGLTAMADPALTEIDFGTWTGSPFDALHGDPTWSVWNSARSLARPPGGESMLEAQVRAVRRCLALCSEWSGAAVAIVSHQDIIKAVLAHILGLSLDCLQRFEIDPASTSAVAVGDWGAKVLFMNWSVAAEPAAAT